MVTLAHVHVSTKPRVRSRERVPSCRVQVDDRALNSARQPRPDFKQDSSPRVPCLNLSRKAPRDLEEMRRPMRSLCAVRSAFWWRFVRCL